MKAKDIVSMVLLLFVAVSVVYLIMDESRSPSEPDDAGPTKSVVHQESKPVEIEQDKAPEDPSQAPEESANAPGEAAGPQEKLIAYYFHRTQRCGTCLNMEAYAEEALREGLADAFESGKVEWRAVNVEEPENEHFVEEYGLTASALVMVLIENGEQKQSKNLERVWELVGNEPEFKDYVRNEALAYLENGS
jgi:hypothetical protein